MKTFKSKLLLFGEYGLMKGARALSVPFAEFAGKLSFDKLPEATESNRALQLFFDYVQTQNMNSSQYHPLDMVKFQADISAGIWFDSNIPQQYGVGSSGALVAAVYDRYACASECVSESDFEQLKSDFALLESYFHGTSSGLDPLVSYLDRPVLFDHENDLKTVPLEQHQQIRLFLVDTKATGATAPLVSYFIRKVTESWFLQKVLSHFIPANDFCIEHFLSGNPDLFFPELYKLVDFQLRHLKRMIPSRYRKMIRESLEDRLFIKLLGSGGGGFLLGFATSDKSIDDFSRRYQLDVIRI